MGLCGLSGCAGGSQSDLPVVSGVSSPGRGEWDDLNAALSWASGRHEMAVLEYRDEPLPSGGVARLYSLITLRNEPVLVRIDRPESGTIYDVRDLTITARVGRFGNPREERALVRDIRARLDRLVEID